MSKIGLGTRLTLLFALNPQQKGIYRLDSAKHSTQTDDEPAGGKYGKLPSLPFDNNLTTHQSDASLDTISKKKIKTGTLCKYLSLFILVLQTAVHVLLVRYASTRQQKTAPFLKSVVVFYSELVKLMVSFVLFFTLAPRSPKKSLIVLYEHFFVRWLDLLKLAIPALAYTLQTWLLYVALENLDAGTYSVTYQLKILTTAFFTVLILKRRLSLVQWLALVVLLGGIITSADQASNAKKHMDVNSTTAALTNKNLTQFIKEKNGLGLNMEMEAKAITHQMQGRKEPSTDTIKVMLRRVNDTVVRGKRAIGNNNGTVAPSMNHGGNANAFFIDRQSPLIGLLSVLAACFLSGFSGVYIEKLLKQSKDVSVWLQNVQLSALALPIAFGMMAIQEGQKVVNGQAFSQGFDAVIWGVVLLQSLGGLITSVVIKYADNILKAFANSFAIIVISVASIFLFHTWPTHLFILGALLVIASLILYSLFPWKKPKPAETVENPADSKASTDGNGLSVICNDTRTLSPVK